MSCKMFHWRLGIYIIYKYILYADNYFYCDYSIAPFTIIVESVSTPPTVARNPSPVHFTQLNHYTCTNIRCRSAYTRNWIHVYFNLFLFLTWINVYMLTCLYICICTCLGWILQRIRCISVFGEFGDKNTKALFSLLKQLN